MSEHRVSFQKQHGKIVSDQFNHLNHMIYCESYIRGMVHLRMMQGSLKCRLAPPTLSGFCIVCDIIETVSICYCSSLKAKQRVTRERLKGVICSCIGYEARYAQSRNREVRERERERERGVVT